MFVGIHFYCVMFLFCNKCAMYCFSSMPRPFAAANTNNKIVKVKKKKHFIKYLGF